MLNLAAAAALAGLLSRSGLRYRNLCQSCMEIMSIGGWWSVVSC